MIILGIETSCDETGASIISATDGKIEILSNIVASSMTLHSKTGGIIPEIAAREQAKFMLPVIDDAFRKANISHNNIDAIAVTIGPGLIGSLLVGVETARTLSYVWNKNLIPVNHLFGHIYANFAQENSRNIQFPSIALIVSGGHTDLVLMNDINSVEWIAGTRDDAAGEAYDKIGRLLSLPYPAGPIIENLAKKGNPKAYNFPRPLMHEETFDFSFSGLKTAVLRVTEKEKNLTEEKIQDISRCVQDSIIDVLISKTLNAAKKYSVKSILLGGGVAANQTLRDEFKTRIEDQKLKTELFVPSKILCTDNGVMIAIAGFFSKNKTDWKSIKANPELYFD